MTLEIFRAGKHRDMSGEEISFSAADVAASAAAYDPARHEAPLVVGHPQHDHPAFGWVKSLKVDGDSLFADPQQVDPAFADLVEKGRFKKISASFYRPDAASNPVPGVWYLRHVGFLGAQPPAVKGLKPIAFADDAGAVTIEFGEVGGWTVSRLFRSLRDFLIAEFGQEKADKALPDFLVDDAQAQAAQPAADIPSPSLTGFTEPPPTPETKMPDPTSAAEATAKSAEAAAQLAEREAQLAKREADFAETTRRAQARTEIDALVKEGRVLPAHADGLVDFMARLDSTEAAAFGEGEAQTPAAFFMEFLKALPKAVDFTEHAAAATAAPIADFAAPPGYHVDAAGLEIHSRALQFQNANPGTEYLAAVKAVGGN